MCVCVCVEDIVIESFVSKTSWSLFQRQKSYGEFCVVFFEDADPRRFGNEFFDFGATTHVVRSRDGSLVLSP